MREERKALLDRPHSSQAAAKILNSHIQNTHIQTITEKQNPYQSFIK